MLLDKRIMVPLKLVFVIDAPDECESEEDIDTVLRLFNETKILSNISLRFFITSRPEGHIQSSFNFISRTSTHPSPIVRKHELHKVVVTDSEAHDNDITKFLTHELRPIAQRRNFAEKWPRGECIRRLSEKSGGLFMYAATMCRFLSGPRLTTIELEQRLQKIVEDKVTKNTPLDALEQIYTPILEISVMGDVSGEDEKEQRSGQFQKVVGALINLSNPLSVKDLSKLLLMNEYIVDAIFQRLHSVVSVDQEDERSPL